MRLCRIRLNDYRAYPIAVLDLPSNGVVMLAGANNSGKSALLSAFDAVLRGQVYADMGYGGAVDWRIILTFEATDRDREELVQAVRKFAPEFDEFQRFNIIEIVFGPLMSSVGAIEINHGLDIRSLTPIARLSPVTAWPVVAPLIGGQVVPGQTSQSRDGWFVHQNRAGFDFEPDHPVNLLLKGVRELSNGFYHFEALRQGAPPSSAFSSTPQLDPTGGNLSAVLRHLSDNVPAVFKSVANTLSELVPELGSLWFRSSAGNDEVVFDDPLMPHLRQNLQNLGTGVEQLLLTLVVGLGQPQARTILIEEPETALEPGAQRALLSLLQQWSHDRLFIVSTHSTAMIDWASAASGQLYYVRRHKGRSSVSAVRREFRGILTALGVRPSDVLSAETVLIIEGTTDRDILGIYLPELMQTPSIAMVPGGGGNHARYAHLLQAWAADSDVLGSRRFVFLRDRDELSTDQIGELEDKGVVRVLPRREIENYLLSVPALQQVFAEDPSVTVSENDVKTALQDAAGMTKEKVILGRVWWQLPPIRLADQSVRSELKDDPDKLNKLIATATDTLMTKDELADRIRQLWSEATTSVGAEWPDRWLSLAPGKDVLMALYRRFLNRDYNEAADGPRLARMVMELDGTPIELRQLLGDLIPSHGTASVHGVQVVDQPVTTGSDS